MKRDRVDPSLVGHVLAENVQATEPIPYFRSSIVDGYAVVSKDSSALKSHII